MHSIFNHSSCCFSCNHVCEVSECTAVFSLPLDFVMVICMYWWIYPDERDSKFPWNIDAYLSDYTVPHTKIWLVNTMRTLELIYFFIVIFWGAWGVESTGYLMQG